MLHEYFADRAEHANQRITRIDTPSFRIERWAARAVDQEGAGRARGLHWE